MNTKVILFDLDGTLLPMEQEIFTKTYFGLLAKKLEPYGYESKKLIESIWTATVSMVKNTGEKTNELVFWDKFAEIYGEDVRNDMPLFEEFYKQDFDKAIVSCNPNPQVAEVVANIKKMGFRLSLATNPIFPSIATEKRIKWAGLKVDDFEFFTAYENSRYSKPNLNYYASIVEKLGVKPEECLMVGNDVKEDMIAKNLGMKVFLLTDYIINKEQIDIKQYPQGNFNDLLKYINQINN